MPSTIDNAREHINEARRCIESLLRNRLTAKESAHLLKTREVVRTMVPRAITVVQSNPHLLAPGQTPASVREVFQALSDLQRLHSVMDSFHNQISDTIRQMDVELYRMMIDAYAIAKIGGGDAMAVIFAEDMKKALALGKRTPKRIVTTRPVPVRLTTD